MTKEIWIKLQDINYILKIPYSEDKVFAILMIIQAINDLKKYFLIQWFISIKKIYLYTSKNWRFKESLKPKFFSIPFCSYTEN